MVVVAMCFKMAAVDYNNMQRFLSWPCDLVLKSEWADTADPTVQKQYKIIHRKILAHNARLKPHSLRNIQQLMEPLRYFLIEYDTSPWFVILRVWKTNEPILWFPVNNTHWLFL